VNKAVGDVDTSWARPKQEYLTLEKQCGQGAGEPGG